MKPSKDAYGQEILAHFKGKKALEIIERNDGYIDSSRGPEVYFAEFKDWPAFEKKAIKFVKGRVLDIGCGAERNALYLQKKGFDVTGIDNSPLAVKVCKARGLKKAMLLPIAGVGKFKPNSFDTVIMFGNNFGLFQSAKKAKSLLRKLYKITSSKALIIAQSTNPYKTSNKAHLAYHKLNKRKGRMAGQLRLRIRFGKFIGEWFDYLLASKKEMKKILKSSRWGVKKFLDSKSAAYIAIIGKT